MPNLTGQSLGRYHLLEKLGEGGMATVYKAYDTRLERDVAVKIIRREAFPQEQLDRMLKRFEREAKALAKLSHPNIVHVHDYGEHEGAPYLVMEYLPGGTLKQRLGQPMPWQEAVRILLPIAQALDYAHEQNIIHRDIKPSNILLTKKGQPMLSDFGIAKILDLEDGQTLSTPGVGIGTPEYMSPEQGLGKPVGPATDVYSLGIVLYELLTGCKPYTADTPYAVVDKHLHDPLPSPRQFVPSLPEDIEKILLKALAKRPEDRYTNMAAFVVALENLLAGQSQPFQVGAKSSAPKPTHEDSMATIVQEATRDELPPASSAPAGQIVPPSLQRDLRLNPPPAKKRAWWPWAAGAGGLLAAAGIVIAVLVVPGLLVTPAPALAEATAANEAPAPTEAPATEAPMPAVPEICFTDAVGCTVIEPGQTIKIGMGAPMTGDNAAFGQDISQGAMIAVSDAGQFQGFSFELVAEDDGGNAEGGASVANKLVSDPQVVAIAGHIFSGATAAAMPIYEAAGIPMMSPSATNPALTQSGSKVFNRCVFTDAAQGKFAAEYLYNKLGIKKLAIMHDGAAYGQGLAQVVNDEFTALGGTVVAFQAIEAGKLDYTTFLAIIASKSPEALFYGGYTGEAVVVVNEMKQSGLEGVIFFGDDGTFGQDFLDRTGANGEGAYSTSLVPSASPAKTVFDAAYLAAYGQTAGKLSPYTWTAYDAAAVLVKAIESVAVLSDGKLYVPRAALVAAVRATSGYQGLSGTITCDATGECSASGPVFNIDQGGKWVEAPK